MMATVPAIAIEKALTQVNLTIDDMKLIEVNKAFAAVPLVTSILLGKEDKKKVSEVRKKK
jgi:acetyl-CoA C-acetyltransferase